MRFSSSGYRVGYTCGYRNFPNASRGLRKSQVFQVRGPNWRRVPPTPHVYGNFEFTEGVFHFRDELVPEGLCFEIGFDLKEPAAAPKDARHNA